MFLFQSVLYGRYYCYLPNLCYFLWLYCFIYIYMVLFGFLFALRFSLFSLLFIIIIITLQKLINIKKIIINISCHCYVYFFVVVLLLLFLDLSNNMLWSLRRESIIWRQFIFWFFDDVFVDVLLFIYFFFWNLSSF